MPKKRLLGCSFPVVIGLGVGAVALILVGFLAGPIGQSLLKKFGISLAFPAWLSIAQPEIKLPAETIFHLFGFPITNSVIAAWITIIVLVSVMYVAFRHPKLVPGKLQNLMEWVLGYMYNLCESVAGEKNGRRFFPIVVTIFLFVVTNAWLALIPGFGSILISTPEGEVPLLRGANTDINLPLALALYSFVFVTFYGLRFHKLHYLGEFFNFGPLLHGLKLLFTGNFKPGLAGIFNGIIAAFVGILELLSRFISILSFTFRLFGNMTAGEILLVMISFLVPFVIADIFYGLELLVGFIQALIFAGLTLVFLAVATAPHEDESAE